ncbi:MAG: heat-shock protein Hsp70, partial [Burkholderiaceae bacterium]|nr:heat-shock protein Hsp70 [Burkholderiaceae bacterium]
MALLQIAEPGMALAPHERKVAIGIDLGTTNSLVAILHPESRQPVALKEFNSSSLVPSVIHFDAAGNVIVGEAARAFLETDPQRTIFSAKRLMGKNYNDI